MLLRSSSGTRIGTARRERKDLSLRCARSFGICATKGLSVADLDMTVPKVARWALSSLPKHLPAVEVQRVLDCCDQTTSTGRRNYAILLLLARLGLRAGEVAALNLEDIDWESARITIHGKGRVWAQLPLPADVGQAIAQYLHSDRPRCSCRRLFIRDRAPHVGFGVAHAISKIVVCADKSRCRIRAQGCAPPSSQPRHGHAPKGCFS